jgi:hypothetical protein
MLRASSDALDNSSKITIVLGVWIALSKSLSWNTVLPFCKVKYPISAERASWVEPQFITTGSRLRVSAISIAKVVFPQPVPPVRRTFFPVSTRAWHISDFVFSITNLEVMCFDY